jgi:hypothetical protein
MCILRMRADLLYLPQDVLGSGLGFVDSSDGALAFLLLTRSLQCKGLRGAHAPSDILHEQICMDHVSTVGGETRKRSCAISAPLLSSSLSPSSRASSLPVSTWPSCYDRVFYKLLLRLSLYLVKPPRDYPRNLYQAIFCPPSKRLQALGKVGVPLSSSLSTTTPLRTNSSLPSCSVDPRPLQALPVLCPLRRALCLPLPLRRRISRRASPLRFGRSSRRFQRTEGETGTCSSPSSVQRGLKKR